MGSGHDCVDVLDQVPVLAAGRGVVSEAQAREPLEYRSAVGVSVVPGVMNSAVKSIMSRPLFFSATSSRTRPSRPRAVRSTAIVMGTLSLDPARQFWDGRFPRMDHGMGKAGDVPLTIAVGTVSR